MKRVIGPRIPVSKSSAAQPTKAAASRLRARGNSSAGQAAGATRGPRGPGAPSHKHSTGLPIASPLPLPGAAQALSFLLRLLSDGPLASRLAGELAAGSAEEAAVAVALAAEAGAAGRLPHEGSRATVWPC
jgi:hypothetical protein